jgi:hypothetical protein
MEDIKEICRPNSSQKTGLISDDNSFLINMLKILSTSNVRLFSNCPTPTLSSRIGQYFS